jgi:hypothetical protein
MKLLIKQFSPASRHFIIIHEIAETLLNDIGIGFLKALSEE